MKMWHGNLQNGSLTFSATFLHTCLHLYLVVKLMQPSFHSGWIKRPIYLRNTHTYSPVSSRWGINHVYTGSSAEDLAVADGMWDVDISIDTAFNKLHVVLCQSASLISKHIFHLEGRKGRVRARLRKVHIEIVYKNVSLWMYVLMYLSQLFIKIGGVDLSSLTQLFVKHLLIPGNKIGAKKFLHLYCHIHRHWDDVIKQDHESQEVCECSDHLQEGG